MSIFISDALAAAQTTAASPQSDNMYSLFMMAAIFIMFYLVLIRPQSKRAKEQRELINNLKKGDEIITSGGILAKIADIQDPYIRINPSEGVEMVLQKSVVIQVLPKGTLKSL